MGKSRWRVQTPEGGWNHIQSVASNSYTVYTSLKADVPDRLGSLQIIRLVHHVSSLSRVSSK